MLKAAKKDSSPPATSTPASVGSSSLSSQAATLRVTSEGLNIVGDGGVLGKGNKSSSQKEQKQKFFATRSADGNWNLLMAPTSDPSRLFLVQPAPGHNFQMTGGKTRKESADPPPESKSSSESSSNGYEDNLPSLVSTPESAEQSPGTSKSVTVPVAQLRASSSISPMPSAHATVASTNAEATTTSGEAVRSCSVNEQKKPTFFKSRTPKDREALKASAQHVVGKKVLFTNRKSSKSSGCTQAGQNSKRGKKGKATGSVKSHKSRSPSSTFSEHIPHCNSLQEPFSTVVHHSIAVVSCSGSATTVSPSVNISTSLTHSCSSPSISSSGDVMSAVDSSVDLSPSSCPSGNNSSETPVDSISCNTDHSHTSQSQNISHCRSNSTGGENVTVEKSSTSEESEAEKSSGRLGAPEDGQMTEKLGSIQSSSAREVLQEQCSDVSNPQMDVSYSAGVDSADPLNCEDGKSPQQVTTSVLLGDESVPDHVSGKRSATTEVVESGSNSQISLSREKEGKQKLRTGQKSRNLFEAVKRVSRALMGDLQKAEKKTSERKECSEFSSDTDDYEFVISDSEKETRSDESVRDSVAHDGVSREMLPRSCYQSDTDLLQKNLTDGGVFASEETAKNSIEQGLTDSGREYTELSEDSAAVTNLSLRTNSQEISSKHGLLSERHSAQSENVPKSKKSFEFTTGELSVNSSEKSSSGLDVDVNFELDSTTKENAQLTESQNKENNRASERISDSHGNQGLVQSEETLSKSPGMSFIGDSRLLSREVSEEAGEGTHAVDISSDEPQLMQKKQKKRKAESDIVETSSPDFENSPLESSGLNQANASQNEPYGNDPKESKIKKRKKRKSEVENLIEMQVAETNNPAVSDVVDVDQENEMQEPDSDGICTLVLQSARHASETLETKKKEAKKTKKKLKFCINLNEIKFADGVSGGEQLVDDESTSFRSVPQTVDNNSEPSTDNLSTLSANVPQCLPQAEHELPLNKHSNPQLLSAGENQDVHKDQVDENVENIQIPCRVTDKAKKKKKKSKKLKIVFGKGQETSTREISSSVKVNCPLNDLDTVLEHRPDDSTVEFQNVTQPDFDHGKETAFSDVLQPKKKRKKRLSELETLIHDQEAYSSHLDPIEENRSQSRTNDSSEKNADHDLSVTDNETQREAVTTENDQDKTQDEPEECRTKDGKACQGNELVNSETSKAPKLPSTDSREALESPLVDGLNPGSKKRPKKKTASKQQTKGDPLHSVKSNIDKIRKKKKKKKLNVPEVVIMPSPSGTHTDASSAGGTDKDTLGNSDPSSCSSAAANSGNKDNSDLNCSLSTDDSLSLRPGHINDILSDTDIEDDEARANKAMKKYLTSRSFGKWELARMFGTPFVVLERLSDRDVYFMSRRFRNARVSSRARCSAHCRLRTLGYLCELDLINCKPPPISPQEDSELMRDAAASDTGEQITNKKKRKRKNKEGCEEDVENKKKKRKKKQHPKEKGSDGDSDVIILADSPQKAPSLTAANSQENVNSTSSTKTLPSFPSATFGRFQIARPSPRLAVSSEQATTSVSSCLITVPSIASNRTSSVPQVLTFPSLGNVSQPSSLPQVFAISSLGTTLGSTNRIIIPPLLMKCAASSLRDATRASLTQAISNSLCKTRLVTPRSTETTPVVSAPTGQPRTPMVVQATGASPSSILPAGPIIVQATVPPPSVAALPKGPIVVQASVASSTTTTTQGDTSAPKQFYVVQMGDKRVLVPAAALHSPSSSAAQPSSASAATTVTVTTAARVILTPSARMSTETVTTGSRVLLTPSVSMATGTGTSGSRVLLTSSASMTAGTVTTSSRVILTPSVSRAGFSWQQSASPVTTVASAPAPGIRPQASSLIPGSMARIVLSNRRHTTIAPRTAPTASTLLFTGRVGTRPNQAWTGPRTVDSHRRVMVTPSSQPQGVRVVLSGAGPVSSGARFTVSSSRGGVFVTSRQPSSVARVTSPRQSRPGKRVMTEEERLRKRARLEKKYPLPPGVVIKTESVSRGYSDEGKTTQANSSTRVNVTGSRTQVNLNQPIPVLSAFRGSPIVIRQTAPVSSTGSRTSSLLGPLIIRMPNASATANTSSTSASVATSTVTALTASSLLSSLNRTSRNTALTQSSLLSSVNRSSSSTTSALPLTYSLLSGNANPTAGRTPSTSVRVHPSTSLVSHLSPQPSSQPRTAFVCAPVVSVSSAPSASSTTPSSSVETVCDSQHNNSADDAIYIVDSPPPEVPASEAENASDSLPQTTAIASVLSASVISQVTSGVGSSPSSPSVSDSSVSTTVVYTSQSPIMLSSPVPSSSTSALSSRMASLGAMWVRQATESPDNVLSIDARSLQSERMQRLKDFLAKQMESLGDERRQKALQALHRQFCQTPSSDENVSDGQSLPVTDEARDALHAACESNEDSRVNESGHQLTEIADDVSGGGEIDLDNRNNAASVGEESAAGNSGENIVIEDNRETSEARGSEETEMEHADRTVTDRVQVDSSQDSPMDSVPQTEGLETNDRSCTIDEDVLALDSEPTSEGHQPATADGGELESERELDIVREENMSQVNSGLESDPGPSGEMSSEEQANKDTGCEKDDGDPKACPDNNCEREVDRPGDPCNTSSEENNGGDGQCQVTSTTEGDPQKQNSATDGKETVCPDTSSDDCEHARLPGDSQEST